MTIVPSTCPVESCPFHGTVLAAEIAHTKRHIKSHDYKILLESAYNLGIIENMNGRRSVDWLADELFKASRIVATAAGVALH